MSESMLLDWQLPRYDAVRIERRLMLGDAPDVWEALLDAGDLRLRDLTTHGEWVLLDVEEPHEITFGAIGRFWSGDATWREIDSAGFAGFAEPGFAKIACSFAMRLCETRRTLVTYECRTQATDPAARRDFLRFWRPRSPLLGTVMRAQLGSVETAVERVPR